MNESGEYMMDLSLCHESENLIVAIKVWLEPWHQSPPCFRAALFRPSAADNSAGYTLAARSVELCSLSRGSVRFQLDVPLRAGRGDCLGWEGHAPVPFTRGGAGTALPLVMGVARYVVATNSMRQTFSIAMQVLPPSRQALRTTCPCCTTLPRCGFLRPTDIDWSSLTLQGMRPESPSAARQRANQITAPFSEEDMMDFRHLAIDA